MSPSVKRPITVGLVLVWALSFAMLAGCIAQQRLYVGPPYDRYDHNRTRRISVEALKDGAPMRVHDEVYRPGGTQAFPKAYYEQAAPGDQEPGDGLPAANVVPIFTGLPLPLSTTSAPAGQRSDREDLIDFLAEGPNAQVGVEPGQTQGDIRRIETCYKPMLDLLSSASLLAGGQEALKAWAHCCEVTFADANVIEDPRYRLRAFKSVVGLRFRRYWFVLYAPSTQDRFSRLVVVPVKLEKEEIAAKGPGKC